MQCYPILFYSLLCNVLLFSSLLCNVLLSIAIHPYHFISLIPADSTLCPLLSGGPAWPGWGEKLPRKFYASRLGWRHFERAKAVELSEGKWLLGAWFLETLGDEVRKRSVRNKIFPEGFSFLFNNKDLIFFFPNRFQ